jgi:hypothetical protein
VRRLDLIGHQLRSSRLCQLFQASSSQRVDVLMQYCVDGMKYGASGMAIFGEDGWLAYGRGRCAGSGRGALQELFEKVLYFH